MKKKILKVVIFLLLAIQLIPIDKTNLPVDKNVDFINAQNVPENIATIFKTSCYDCHSNEVVYPWYTNISPLKFWIKQHINEGQEELNFSEWGTYSLRKAAHKLEEAIEMVEEGEMPLKSYTLMHWDAKLDDIQKAELISWLKINYDTLQKQSVIQLVTGEFIDDYDYTYSINKTVWKHDTLNSFQIIKWNFNDMYFIAKNDSSNQGEQGLFSRIDITFLRDQEPYTWGYCLTEYKANSAEEAEKAAAADRKNLKEGCNGYPFSRMKPVN